MIIELALSLFALGFVSASLLFMISLYRINKKRSRLRRANDGCNCDDYKNRELWCL